ncbi:MAG: ribonuclease III [Christensenellaceae bacterium]|nr:ribonuclease III [Christensenellaceae bacterium]
MKKVSIGYEFKDPGLLKQAFTHASYANEYNELSNERLEYLGDSVLNMLISDYLFNNHKIATAGELTQNRSRINKNEVLSKVGEKFFENIRLGRSFDGKGDIEDIKAKADLVEAIIGAIWQDSRDLGDCLKFLKTHFDFEKLIAQDNDFKTRLQQITQKDGGELPKYDTPEKPQEDGKYYSKVFIGGQLCGVGSGNSKKHSQMSAAEQALNKITKD